MPTLRRSFRNRGANTAAHEEVKCGLTVNGAATGFYRGASWLMSVPQADVSAVL